jgi:hypothetical protein
MKFLFYHGYILVLLSKLLFSYGCDIDSAVSAVETPAGDKYNLILTLTLSVS